MLTRGKRNKPCPKEKTIPVRARPKRTLHSKGKAVQTSMEPFLSPPGPSKPAQRNLQGVSILLTTPPPPTADNLPLISVTACGTSSPMKNPGKSADCTLSPDREKEPESQIATQGSDEVCLIFPNDPLVALTLDPLDLSCSPECPDLGTQSTLQKVAKQLKLVDSHEATKNPSPTSSPDCCIDQLGVIDLSRFSPLTGGLIKDLIDEQMGWAPTTTGVAGQKGCVLDQMLQHVSSTAADVKQILNHLESISTLLKECMKCPSKNPHQRKADHLFRASESQIAPAPLQQPLSPRADTPVTKLTLKTKSVALLIKQQPGQVPDWSQPWMAKKHLITILKLKPIDIDLCSMERLPSSPRQMRVLLHFHTSRIPNQIFAHAQCLRGMGILPQRHFQNQTIQKLISGTTASTNSLFKEDSSAKDNLIEFDTDHKTTYTADALSGSIPTQDTNAEIKEKSEEFVLTTQQVERTPQLPLSPTIIEYNFSTFTNPALSNKDWTERRRLDAEELGPQPTNPQPMNTAPEHHIPPIGSGCIFTDKEGELSLIEKSD